MSILNIPEGKSREWSVIHMDGQDGINHRLVEASGGIWMDDGDVERGEAESLVEDFKGNILVGGLGLGYVVQVLAENPEVRTITVVEKSLDVLALVAQHVDDKGKAYYVCAGIEDYLNRNPGTFDWAYYDTWQSRRDMESPRKMRLISVGIIPLDNVRCWPEMLVEKKAR